MAGLLGVCGGGTFYIHPLFSCLIALPGEAKLRPGIYVRRVFRMYSLWKTQERYLCKSLVGEEGYKFIIHLNA